ncbi:MAG: glycosyltransferase family 39 protein [Limisphaerales bacterium]
MDPVPPENGVRLSRPVKAVFVYSFTLDKLPANATLAVRAFKTATVFINGQHIAGLKCDGKNWKTPATASIAGELQAGTNTITVCVTNQTGPPTLWLRLQTDTLSIGSDATWQVSLAGAAWQNARIASQPLTLPGWSPLYDNHNVFDSLRNVWQELVFFLASAFGLVFLGGRWLSARPEIKPVCFIFILVVVARTALFINDMSGLSHWTGFDTKGHEDYIKFIQEKQALPPSDSGWETHQPPLYYFGSAMVMNLTGFSVGQENAVIPLRAINGILGFINCWMALVCLRRLFPENPSAQVVGLLLAAFLPPHLYLFMGITNDPLTGLLVTTAFYFLLRVLQSETENIWYYAGIGLTLGAAMLTKLTAMPAVPVFFLALIWRMILLQKKSALYWLRGVGLVALIFAVVCGWHYGRVWQQTGVIAVPNSQSTSWWQEPGFRTASYYLNFGHVLVSPLFSGLYSFADGIYSTLWGDGLISGASKITFRPPWNYDLMNACYFFSLAITILAVGGMVISLQKFRHLLKLEWFVMPALIFSYLMAIVCLTLLAPWAAEVKAFYAFPALVPFCAMVATGWNWLAKKNRLLRNFLWLVVIIWSFTAYTTYWIRPNNFETWRARAFVQLKQQDFPETITNITEALRLKPDDFVSRCIMAEAFQGQDKQAEALQQYLEALAICPDSPDSLFTLAKIFAVGPKDEAEYAVKLAERACQLTGYGKADMVDTLIVAFANARQTEKALALAENARDVASQNDEPDQARRMQELIERIRLNKDSGKPLRIEKPAGN